MGVPRKRAYNRTLDDDALPLAVPETTFGNRAAVLLSIISASQ
jgi:hypothetical protein